MFRVLTDEESRSVKRWQAPSLNTGNRPVKIASQSGSLGLASSENSFDANESDGPTDVVPTPETVQSAVDSFVGSSDETKSAQEQNKVGNAMNTSAEMLQSSYDEGYSAGYAEGNAAAFESSNLNMSQLLDELSHQQVLHDEQLLEDIIDLVKVTAGLILHREIQIDATTLKDWVIEGLNRLPTVSDPAVVHMHPLDASNVKQLLDPDVADSIIEDAELCRGDCHIESGASSIRTGIHEQINRLASKCIPNDSNIKDLQGS